MQKVSPLRGLPAVALGSLLLLTACDRPESAEVPSEPQLAALSAASLLPCPSTETASSQGIILPLLGGIVSLAGNSVLVPATAVLGGVHIELTVPASPYMLVDLTANGQEHWQFRAPVTVTIDYSRCDVGLLDPPVNVWHVDASTGELLEPMGGLDDRLLRRVTFTTDHFSGYAIAN